MNETTSSTKPAGGTRPVLTSFKTVEWAYPYSHNAEQYGFIDTGCWVASLVNPSMIGETYDTIAIYGASEEAKAVEMASAIDRPWLPSYLQAHPELVATARTPIPQSTDVERAADDEVMKAFPSCHCGDTQTAQWRGPRAGLRQFLCDQCDEPDESTSAIPADSELLDAIEDQMWHVSYMLWKWVVQSNGQVVGNIAKGSTLREALGSALSVTEPITADPVTADQVNAVLDFATVAGITNKYAASLHGSAARMSAESLCRFCVLNPGTLPAEVYESILPVSRPNYGDILAAANWLLLGLAPEAMEYRPLRAVREWVLGYMGGSEK